MDKEIEDFINEHKLKDYEIYDAKGQHIRAVYGKMKTQNRYFAYNTNVCIRGHHFRDIRGNCIMCLTSNISFTQRNYAPGLIYITGSKLKQIIKVGFTKATIERRIKTLNSENAGGSNDWIALRSFKNHKAGELEPRIHKALKPYAAKGITRKDGTESKEIFRCSFDKANEIINSIIEDENWTILDNKRHTFKSEDYKFRNLRAV